MKQLLFVFIGGGFGSALRYLIGKFLNTSGGFPYGTFLANLLGSLLIGVILGLAQKHNTLSQNITLLLAVGFCGGFTTFSTFAYENIQFLKSQDYFTFALYSILSFAISLIAVFIGLYFTNK